MFHNWNAFWLEWNCHWKRRCLLYCCCSRHIDMVESIILNKRWRQQLRVQCPCVCVCGWLCVYVRLCVCQRPRIKNSWQRIMNEVVRIDRRSDNSNWPREHLLICATLRQLLLQPASSSQIKYFHQYHLPQDYGNLKGVTEVLFVWQMIISFSWHVIGWSEATGHRFPPPPSVTRPSKMWTKTLETLKSVRIKSIGFWVDGHMLNQLQISLIYSIFFFSVFWCISMQKRLQADKSNSVRVCCLQGPTDGVRRWRSENPRQSSTFCRRPQQQRYFETCRSIMQTAD